MLNEISKFGKKLVERGYVTSHGGNISVRQGDKILITRRGCMLDEIGKDDLIETDLEGTDSKILLASTDIRIHREIYKETSALAVIHCHSPYAVVLSLSYDEIIPLDMEGDYLLHKIPIVEGPIGGEILAKKVSHALKENKGVIARGHGTIAIGRLLEEAYQVISLIEHTCMIKYLFDLYGKEIKGKIIKEELHKRW